MIAERSDVYGKDIEVGLNVRDQIIAIPNKLSFMQASGTGSGEVLNVGVLGIRRSRIMLVVRVNNI